MKNISVFAFFLLTIASYGTFSASIAAGCNHSLLVDEDCNVWTFGAGGLGQLGHGLFINRWGKARGSSLSLPKKIENLPRIKAVAAGELHSLVLDIDGHVWTFGFGKYGQLGHGPVDCELIGVPKKLENLPPITAVAAGHHHSLLLDENGYVWTFGRKMLHENDQWRPGRLENLPSIIAVAAGDYHSLLLDEEGHVWTFGKAGQCQLGYYLGRSFHEVPRKLENLLLVTAVAGGEMCSLVLDADGHLWGFGDRVLGSGYEHRRRLSGLEMIENLPLITTIAQRKFCSFLLDMNGQVWSCGSGKYGQLGHEDKEDVRVHKKIEKQLPPITTVALGYEHTLMLDIDGSVWSFGSGNCGNLGHGDDICYSSPKVIQLSVKIAQPNFVDATRKWGKTKSARGAE